MSMKIQTLLKIKYRLQAVINEYNINFYALIIRRKGAKVNE